MLIVADDLSGAADCGVGCAISNLRTLILLDRNAGPIDADVVAVDADSRRMSSAQAEEVTEAIIHDHLKGRRQFLYKKLDSTLRGNVGVELTAALKAFRSVCKVADGERGIVVLAPAFPKGGRTTVAGRQLVYSVPLEHTEIGRRDGLVDRAYLPGMLRASGLHPHLIPLNLVRSGRELLQREMNELRSGADVLVCDAETDEDLCTIATAAVSLGPGVMWAGSAGLAHQLSRVARISRTDCFAAKPSSLACGPTLIAVGSLAGTSREQIAALPHDVLQLCITPDVLRAGTESPEWYVRSREIHDAVRSGSDAVVFLSRDANADLSQGRFLATALANLILPCANEIGALVLTGGETARSVLSALGVNRLRLLGELEPGLPISITEGWHRNLPVLTKAGDFGNRQSLVHCREYLRSLDRSSML